MDSKWENVKFITFYISSNKAAFRKMIILIDILFQKGVQIPRNSLKKKILSKSEKK
jgi:hypothetical protein